MPRTMASTSVSISAHNVSRSPSKLDWVAGCVGTLSAPHTPGKASEGDYESVVRDIHHPLKTAGRIHALQ